jgi:hypothetical protein
VNILRRFVANCAEITKGFMRLLKKGVQLCWGEASQCSFEALKCALMSSPLLQPLNYNKYFLLYLDAAESTINMVLVQKDYMLEEKVIYYLRRGLFGPKLNYYHVEKLSLAGVHAIQRFRHYILFRNTTVIAIINPLQYVLTRRVIGGNISRWTIILHEFDLDFVSVKSKKSLILAVLILEMVVESSDITPEESPINGDPFLIASLDP